MLVFPPDEIAPVPPNATVVFEVELYSISRGPRSVEAFREMDVDGDRSLSKAEVIIIPWVVIITKVAKQEKAITMVGLTCHGLRGAKQYAVGLF